MSNYFSRSGNALTTRRDSSGIDNYVISSSVPGFSMTGSQPFTILVTLCFRDVSQGAIFRQEGVFELSLVNEELTFNAGICNFTIPKKTITFVPGVWYMLGVMFNGEFISLYVDGFKSAITNCSVTSVDESEAYYEIGHGLEAYFREVILYPFALTDEEVHASYMNAPAQGENCAAWYDFSGVEIAERTGKATISVKGFTSLVNLTEVLSAESGLVHYLPFNVYQPGIEGYTWLTKLYPQRTENKTMYLAANSDVDRTYGWALYLQKENDDIFRPYLQMGGSKGPLLVSDRTVETFRWTDVAWVYDGNSVALFVDGELAGNVANITPEILQGDGRTTFCGVRRHGKTDSESYYSGYIAHISEFHRAVDAESLKGYMINQPYVLDEGIVSVFDFTDENLTEKCTLQPFTLSGQTIIKWVENTNQLADPQQTAIYMPEQENLFWDNLSDELKWETKLFGDIFNSYLCDVMGYEMDEESKLWYQPSAEYIVKNVLTLPEFRQVVKQGSNVKERELNNLIKSVGASGMLLLLGKLIETVGKGASRYIGRKFLYLMVATALVAGILVKIIKQTKKVKDKVDTDQTERPKNPRLLNFSIEFNHQSDPATGGIHIRRDRHQAVEPPEWRMGQNDQNNPALCAYIVPIQNDPRPHIVVRIQYETDVPLQMSLRANEQGGLLGNIQSNAFQILPNAITEVIIPLPANHLNDNPGNLFQAETRTWEWHCNIDVEDFFLTNTFHKVYRLLGQPVNPWRFHEGVYNPGIVTYPWTSAMDVATEIYDRGVANGGGEFLECLAKGLNATPNFRYQGNYHYFFSGNLSIFNIDMFQQHFNVHDHVWGINCSDCSGVVGTYGNLHGEDLIILFLCGNNNGELGFECNPIIVIGEAEWAEPFEGDGFAFHRIVAPRGNDFAVTDACLKIDAGLYPSEMPGEHEKKPIIACNMQFSNNLVDNQVIEHVNVHEPFELQVYRERLAKNEVSCTVWEHIDQWILGNVDVVPVPIEVGMTEYYRRIGEYYEITTDMTVSSEVPLIPASSLRLDVVPNLVRLGSENRLCEYPEPFTYKGKQILISIQVCDSVAKAKTSLVYKLGDINYRHIPTAEEMGIELGEKAFIIQDKDGLCTCVLLYRRNVVIYLLCTTTESIDLLPLANALDRQMLEE